MAESRRKRICLRCGAEIDKKKQVTAIYCSKKCQKRSTARRQYMRRIDELPKATYGDAEVVSGPELSKILVQWRKDYDKRYNITKKTDFTKDGVTSSLQWLSQESGTGLRYLRGILAVEQDFVSVWRADKILTAIGQHYHIMNGTLKVVPNPRWSNEDWIDYMQKRGCY